MGFTTKFVGFGAMMGEIENLQINIKSDAVYVVGTNVEYAVYQEFGTSKMAAQPYLRPAVREVEREIPRLAEKAGSADELVKLVALEIESVAADKAPVDLGNLMDSISAERVR